jgi:hypothetical protein
MSEELAKLYIRYDGQVYRIKVFSPAIGIERQPGGENVLLSKADEPDANRVYNPEGGVWDYDALTRLIERYPHYENPV